MKHLKTLTIILLVALLVLSCQGTPTAPTQESTQSPVQPTAKTLTIGILPAESAIPLIVALNQNYFKEAGLAVKIQAFSSPNDRNVALQSGAIDGTIGDVMTAAAFYDKGLDVVITSDILEDFKVLSSPASGITELKGLSGKKISLVKNFILEYIMDSYANKHNFSYEIVEIASFAGRAEALMANQIDGVLYTEPTASLLVSQGAHLLASSKADGIKGGTIIFKRQIVNEHASDLQAFYTAYNKAIDFMNNNDASVYAAGLTAYQFPDAIAFYLQSLKGTFTKASVIPKDQFDDIIQWTVSKKMIQKAISYEELTNFSFLPQN